MEKAQGLIVNDVVIEVPKPATEDTLGTVTLTDDFTYTGAEEHLAVTPKAALLFKQKLDDLVTTGGGMYVRAPTVTAPTGDDVAISGAVITASAFAPLVQGATRYNRRFELSKTEDFAELVWSVAKNEDSTEIGVVLENDVDYYVRVKDFCVEGYVSPWSNVHKFNTATGIPAATPTVTVKEQNIFKSVTLQGSAFAMSDGSSATHKCTDWKIYQGHNLIWSSLQDSTNLVQIVTPEILSENTAYNVEVRYYPNTGLPSAVGTTTFTTEADFGHVLTPTLTVTLKDGLASVPIKVSTSAFAVSVGSDTHRATTWKLYKTEDLSTPVWESEEDTVNLTSIAIPADRNTTYKITCQFHGTKLGDSAVGEATCTTNNILIKENYIGIPGTSTFGVGLATKEQYESVLLQPAPNCESEDDFQYALYIRGSATTSGDSVAMKFIPPFYIVMLQKNDGTVNLSDSELDALLPYVEVTKDQMKEAQRRSPHNAMAVAPFDAFTDEEDANLHGFYLMRGFVDDGKISGFFIANTITGYIVYSNGLTSGIQALRCGCDVKYNISNLKLWRISTSNKLYDETWDYKIFFPNFHPDNNRFSSNAKGNIIGACEGTPYQCCSFFAWAVISVLSLIQGQYATDTAQCAWYDSTLVHNYPKGINQNTKDVDDASVTSDVVNGTQGNVFVTQGYEKTTHNGSITGITNVNGWLWQYVIGSWGDGSKLLKRSASIYDITYDNVDNSGASFWEAHDVSRVSSQWGGTKSSFPDFTGADRDLFGVYSFGGNTSQNSNEFGLDNIYRYSLIPATLVGGHYNENNNAGVFSRYANTWNDTATYSGFRAMAYPRTTSGVAAKITLTANGGGGTPEIQSVVVDSGTTFGDAVAKLTQPTKTGYDFKGWA